MNRLALIPLAPMLLAGSVQAQAPAAVPLADHVIVDKSARTISLYADGERLHTIKGIQLGDAPVGHKRFQGDERTPEGHYTIDFGNAQSAYHLSLHISYPSEADAAFARALGRDPGGAIFIHGQPNGLAGRVPGDWTDGCIAVSNEEIELMWERVPDGTVIDILP